MTPTGNVRRKFNHSCISHVRQHVQAVRAQSVAFSNSMSAATPVRAHRAGKKPAEALHWSIRHRGNFPTFPVSNLRPVWCAPWSLLREGTGWRYILLVELWQEILPPMLFLTLRCEKFAKQPQSVEATALAAAFVAIAEGEKAALTGRCCRHVARSSRRANIRARAYGNCFSVGSSAGVNCLHMCLVSQVPSQVIG